MNAFDDFYGAICAVHLTITILDVRVREVAQNTKKKAKRRKQNDLLKRNFLLMTLNSLAVSSLRFPHSPNIRLSSIGRKDYPYQPLLKRLGYLRIEVHINTVPLAKKQST